MSNLFDQVSNDIQKAMLAHDHVRTETLRGVKKEFLEAKTAKGAEGELTDSHAIEILQKMKKQRLDAAQIYRDNGRPELAEGEEASWAPPRRSWQARLRVATSPASSSSSSRASDPDRYGCRATEGGLPRPPGHHI